MASNRAWRVLTAACTARSGSDSMRAVNPRRSTGWSSTTSSAFRAGWTGSVGVAHIAWTFTRLASRRQAQGARDHCPALGSPRHREATADRARPIVHRMQPHPITMTIIFRQPKAIVLDAQQTFAPGPFQTNFDLV